MSKWSEYKARCWGSPVPSYLNHGPDTAAAKAYGCDCQACLPSGKRTWRNTEDATGPKSHNERQKALRASKKGQPVPEGTSHGGYAYRVYACRCDVCKAGNAAAHAKQSDAWRSKARGRWTTVGAYETICWPPRDAGPEWTCPYPHHQEVA